MIKNKKQLKKIIDRWNGKYKHFYIKNKKTECHNIVKIYETGGFGIIFIKNQYHSEWSGTVGHDRSVGYDFNKMFWGFPIEDIYPIDEDERFILCLEGLKLK